MTATTDTDAREAFAERLIEDTTRALETLSVYLGVELGLYQAVAACRTGTFADVAAKANVAPRYAREWLEQQATAGYVDCLDTTVAPDDRRYQLAPAAAEVLLDQDSSFHVSPATRMFAGVASVLPQLVTAYRSGGGVAYSAYGQDIRRGIGELNQPLFRHELTSWLAAVPDVHDRLRSTRPASVLDLGCGRGHSCVAIALAYPEVTVYGVDLDEASIAEARTNAAAAGVADRVTLTVDDAANSTLGATFDLVTMFETLHDMGDPVGTLRAARKALTSGGAVFIGDDKAAEEFTAPGDLLERFQFGWSVLHCLPATLAEDPVEAHGTMLRPATLRRWGHEAGFAEVEVAPIDNDFWRFYVLRP